MTLKEKFDNLDYFDSSDIINNLSHDSHECEIIAEEFAIDFLNWYAMHGSWIEDNLTSKELLEIYKKEKQL
jgi:hypothetical protein